MYKWSFDSVWAENFDYTKGSSQLEGLFKPDNDMGYKFVLINSLNFVFKGENPSIINILLCPIFFHNKDINQYLSGFRADFKSYTVGSIKNNYNFYGYEDKIRLQFKVN